MREGARDREGLLVKTGWFANEFLPFDEVMEVDGAIARLASGVTRSLGVDQLDGARRALCPPEPRGVLADDAQALQAYVEGAWSPVRAALLLLEMATALGASDVHLQAVADGFEVRMRLAGELVDFARLSSATGSRLIAACKHISGCLPYRTDVIQEGRVPRDGVAADVRASFMPTALGERAALRLFGTLLDLSALGLEPEMLARFEAVLRARSGLVVVAGPSGGGKTTTLYAVLGHLAALRGDAHLSLEDPVEQRLRLAGIGVDQVELDPDRGLTAEAALVAALRQDVDVLAVGEIRTPAEAALALKAAHTGRLVLAGVHAGNAAEGRRRLLDLEADPAVLEQTLLAVLHQRLVTDSCPACHGEGCPACSGIGRVRKPVAELWTQEDER